MKLRDWLAQKHMTREAFADRIGTDHSTVTRYVHGRMPRMDILARIIRETGGEVTANDFVPDADQISREPARQVG